MARLENKLTWSVSRLNTLRYCPRRYYYSYYGAWGGWEANAGEEARLAYLLKNRQGIPGWIGDKTHQAIERWLKHLRPDPAEIIRTLCCEMDDEFERSRRMDYLKPWGRRKDFGLIEHYRGEKIAPGRLQEIKDRVAANFTAFLDWPRRPALEAFKALRQADPDAAGRLFTVDEREDFARMKFRVAALGGLEIFAAPDLCYEPVPGRCLVIDWKTGAPPPDGQSERLSDQLLVLSLRLRDEARDPERLQIEAREVYLPSGREVGGPVGSADLEHITAEISRGLAEMRSWLVDPRRNQPKAREAFPRTDRPEKCAACNFFSLCRPEPESRPDPPPAAADDRQGRLPF